MDENFPCFNFETFKPKLFLIKLLLKVVLRLSDILSKDDYPHTSGNYGLSDILQALSWIQLNIGYFGGDKNAVTLFGHKAGATLVTALATMSNKGKKKFVRLVYIYLIHLICLVM